MREYVDDIELVIDTRALLDDKMVEEGDKDNETNEDGDTLLLTLTDTLFVAVEKGLEVDLVVGVTTAVFNAVEEGDPVIIPVIVMEVETEDVNVFCTDEVTDTEPEKEVIDESELLALIEGVLRPVELVLKEIIGDDVIESVVNVVDERVFDIKELTLGITDDDTADDKDGTTVIVDVIDASIETVVERVLSAE